MASVSGEDLTGLDHEGGSEEVPAAKAHIRERGRRISTRERERALQRLRAHDDITKREEAVVRELAQSLTDALLGVPESQLDSLTEEQSEPDAAAVVLDLFGER